MSSRKVSKYRVNQAVNTAFRARESVEEILKRALPPKTEVTVTVIGKAPFNGTVCEVCTGKDLEYVLVSRGGKSPKKYHYSQLAW